MDFAEYQVGKGRQKEKKKISTHSEKLSLAVRACKHLSWERVF